MPIGVFRNCKLNNDTHNTIDKKKLTMITKTQNRKQRFYKNYICSYLVFVFKDK